MEAPLILRRRQGHQWGLLSKLAEYHQLLGRLEFWGRPVPLPRAKWEPAMALAAMLVLSLRESRPPSGLVLLATRLDAGVQYRTSDALLRVGAAAVVIVVVDHDGVCLGAALE